MITQQSTQATRDAIAAANQRFVDAFRRADAEDVAACYTPDAQLLPNHSDFVGGTPAIAAFWRGVMELGVAAARLESVEMEPLGDTVVEIGRYTMSTGDGTVADRGKYLVVWHRREGSWLIHRDIWTTSVPAAPG